MNLGPIADWGLNLDQNRIVENNKFWADVTETVSAGIEKEVVPPDPSFTLIETLDNGKELSDRTLPVTATLCWPKEKREQFSRRRRKVNDLDCLNSFPGQCLHMTSSFWCENINAISLGQIKNSLYDCCMLFDIMRPLFACGVNFSY